MSLTSWGEDITVWLVPMPFGTRAYIESRSAPQPALFDWGRNQRQVDRIAVLIATDPPPPAPVDGGMPQDRPA
jgi:hypothetical protein